MKVSIITICRNNEKDIIPTLESVKNQTYKDIEYIIVDGASTDKTLSIIENYKSIITTLISEPDKGLYDAINKGIKKVTGDIVGLIHAGDQLYNDLVIEKIVNHFIKNDIDLSYGHSIIVKSNGDIQRVNKSPEFSKSLMRRGWMPSHQSIYIKREFFDKFGFYRLDIGPSSDYEFCVRYLYKEAEHIKIKRIDDYIVKFSLGGVSTKSYRSRLSNKQSNIIKKCWQINDLKPPFAISYLKLFGKFKQFILAYFS